MRVLPVLALAALVAGPSLAFPAPPLAFPVALLPQPALGQAAVWTGDRVLLLGGGDHVCYCTLDTVVGHDPAEGEVELLDLRLPRPAIWRAAVWDGHRVHLFDGPLIVHLDLARGEVAATVAPRSVPHTEAAFFDGAAAFVFSSSGRPMLRYVPGAPDYEELPVRRPPETAGAAVASDGRVAWLFGGNDAAPVGIWRFDPAHGFTRLGAQLPTAMSRPAAMWDASSATVLVAGGFGNIGTPGGVVGGPGVSERREVWRFDPRTEELTLAGLLPVGSWGMAAASTPHGAFTYGGGCTCPPMAPFTPSGDPEALLNEAVGATQQHGLVLRLPS